MWLRWGFVAVIWLGLAPQAEAADSENSFTAHPVQLFGSTSLNSRRTPPRHGRVATGPAKRRLNRPGAA